MQPTSRQSQSQEAKPFRFVTNYGAPHPKRRRIASACLTCRKRKTACSGEQPSCATCKQNKLVCEGFSNEPARRHESGSHSGQSHNVQRAARPLQASNPTSLREQASRPPMQQGSSPRHGPDSAPVQEALLNNSSKRNRMPYFRWLGPTAIMPGFKQMVVKVKRKDADMPATSSDGAATQSASVTHDTEHSTSPSTLTTSTPATVDSEPQTSLPFYDDSSSPPSKLIIHLVETFFVHLACNFPFLNRRRFLRDLVGKRADAVLVHAVCALAARFSTHSLLVQNASDGDYSLGRAEYGHAFAQRAKIALTESFACPSVAVAQAALLLAYNEFGEQKDSGLWMYLGIAIRLAQDLGMHTSEGLKYVGRSGPTPRMVKHGSSASIGIDLDGPPEHTADTRETLSTAEQTLTEEEAEQRAGEQERVDTFWAIFFLDRAVSSGTGRMSTLRDKEIELSFPPARPLNNQEEWSAPFPALVRVIHLYGRVADLLNGIKEPADIARLDIPQRLTKMETQVTNFYQSLSLSLHFDAVNFQHYMKAGQGTNFVLLHFWFHSLIILLHQPTLLKPFRNQNLQLFANSQQLSMSSAKTIADILSYSQLMDAKASLGNPFTTQPIYVAARVFLKEAKEQTAASSTQDLSAGAGQALQPDTDRGDRPEIHAPKPIPDLRSSTKKHSLLAAAASQHYQLCFKALQSLETYWAGAKYILTVLEQQYAGVIDPVLYTPEEGESAMERPKTVPAFTSPGWRRRLSQISIDSDAAADASPLWLPRTFAGIPGSPAASAIGYTLTGTMNSPSTNLACHYASSRVPNKAAAGARASTDPRISNLMIKPELDAESPGINAFDRIESIQAGATVPAYVPAASSTTTDPGDLASNYASSDTTTSQRIIPPFDQGILTTSPESSLTMTSNSTDDTPSNRLQQTQQSLVQYVFNTPFSFREDLIPTPMTNTTGMPLDHQYPFPAASSTTAVPPTGLTSTFQLGGANDPFNSADLLLGGADLTIQSQDVDMSILGLDMLPWFQSFPTHDVGNLMSGVPPAIYDPSTDSQNRADGQPVTGSGAGPDRPM